MLISNSTAEAFGRVIVEAMAHGVVVLARASGGIPEIVTHGQNGWLFTNQEEFSQGFNWLVKNRNTDQLVWMKENAYATIQQKFSQEHYATVIRALLVA
jgi:glycosyltransferase involved in cell wall biosynthesis